MKKVLIIILIIIVLVLIGVWGYLMLYGVPEELPSFTDVLDNTSEPVTPGNFPDPVVVPDETFDDAPQNAEIIGVLSRLTERQVAGAVFTSENGTESVRYAERGTGHIYEIDAATGQEERVTITTIPRTTRVVFAPSGNRAVFTIEANGLQNESFIGTVVRDDAGSNTLEQDLLVAGASNFMFDAIGDTLFYTVSGPNGTVGYERDLKTDSETERFSIPLRDVVVIWDENRTYAYPKPTSELSGGLYEINGNSLTRIGDDGNGLMAEVDASRIALSTTDEEGVRSRFMAGGTETPLAISMFPQKCDFSSVSTTTLWCAAPLTATNDSLPDEWHQGVVSFDDIFWRVSTESGEAELIFFFSEETTTPIDAVDFATNEDDTYAFFKNKNDQTLWLIDLTQI